jgi:large subunit ribosomal protein L10
MNRTEKASVVESLGKELGGVPNAVLFGFAGLKVTEVTELRRQVRGAQSSYLVVKNTLALRAVQGTPLEALSSHFAGPTAVAYNRTNPVALAKVLTAFAKANPNLVFKAALIDGQPVETAAIKTIAEMPSREELVAKLVGLMQSPLRRLVMVLNGPARSLAGTLSQIADQKSKSGEAAAAPAE